MPHVCSTAVRICKPIHVRDQMQHAGVHEHVCTDRPPLPWQRVLSKPSHSRRRTTARLASLQHDHAKLIAISVCTAGVSLGVSCSGVVGCDIPLQKTEVERLYSN